MTADGDCGHEGNTHPRSTIQYQLNKINFMPSTAIALQLWLHIESYVKHDNETSITCPTISTLITIVNLSILIFSSPYFISNHPSFISEFVFTLIPPFTTTDPPLSGQRTKHLRRPRYKPQLPP